jgi:hypothetical protein
MRLRTESFSLDPVRALCGVWQRLHVRRSEYEPLRMRRRESVDDFDGTNLHANRRTNTKLWWHPRSGIFLRDR